MTDARRLERAPRMRDAARRLKASNDRRRFVPHLWGKLRPHKNAFGEMTVSFSCSICLKSFNVDIGDIDPYLYDNQDSIVRAVYDRLRVVGSCRGKASP